MTIEKVSMGRFQVFDQPIAVPGNCIVCGSVGDNKRKFVDFGITLEFTGVVYFCTFCLSELSEAMGFVSREQLDEAIEVIKKKNEELKELADECERLRSIANAIDFLGLHSVGPASPDVSSDRDDDASHDGDVESESRNVEGVAKSTDGRGRKNVSNSPTDNVDF